MAQDLAARISDGSIAVLELVPGEQRFHELSRFVLRGGASRFAAAVLEDEPVRYVLPVGVPGRKLDYGTLLIQRSRCALVWRTDPARPYHARIADLGPETTINQSPVTIRGEVWGRFDVQAPGQGTMTFLVPPVASTALPSMLHRVLVEEPQSRLGHVDALPLPLAVTDGPDPAAEPVQPPAPAAAPVAEPEAPAVEATPATPEAPVEAAAPEPVAQPVPERPEPDALDDLYRPAERTSPGPAAQRHPEPEDTGVTTPVPPTPGQATATPATAPAAVLTAPAASTTTAPAAPSAQPARRLTDSLSGFLTGLIVTLVVGGLILLAKYLGWLG